MSTDEDALGKYQAPAQDDFFYFVQCVMEGSVVWELSSILLVYVSSCPCFNVLDV